MPSTKVAPDPNRFNRTMRSYAIDLLTSYNRRRVTPELAYYTECMLGCGYIDEPYGVDTAAMVVGYFLGVATSWTGPIARQAKADLRALLADYYADRLPEARGERPGVPAAPSAS